MISSCSLESQANLTASSDIVTLRAILLRPWSLGLIATMIVHRRSLLNAAHYYASFNMNELMR